MTRQEASDFMWEISDKVLGRIDEQTKGNPKYDYTATGLDKAVAQVANSDDPHMVLTTKLYAMVSMKTPEPRGDWFEALRVVCQEMMPDGSIRFVTEVRDGVLAGKDPFPLRSVQ